ncbi:MAG: hypothetical protein N2512_05630 [Armatimonadetes bacterium]|nr:hypothetical protein [Armatimonadota bacterium]
MSTLASESVAGTHEKAREGPRDRPRVTLRAIVLGFLLVPLHVYWIVTVEGIYHWSHCTAVSLYWNVIFNLMILLAINAALKRFAPRFALTQAEFVTVYVMIAVASALAGHDTLQLGVPNLTIPYYYATDANHWEELFHRYLPTWATVSQWSVLRPLYDGHTTLYTPDRLAAWLGPTLWWTAVISAVGLVMIGTNVLIRRQWTQREKLGYPIVQLPLEMTRGGLNYRFFSSRTLWVGFALAALLDLYNGLTFFWPALPIIDVRHDRNHFIDTWSWGRPLNAMGRIWIPLYPFIIGLSFLLPADLSFSIWFFYLFRKFQQVLAAAWPIPLAPELPYLNEQSMGAWTALFVYALLVGRGYFAALGRSILRGELSREMDPAEPMSHRAAFVAIVAGGAFLLWFAIRAGMSAPVAVVFFAFAMVLHTAITRMRAELGPPAHEMAGGMNSAVLLRDLVGTKALGPANISIFPLFWWLTGRGYRTTPMPVQLEGLKMGEESGAEPQRLAVAMAIAFALGAFLTCWFFAHLTYMRGNNPMIGHNIGQWDMMASWLQYPQPVNVPGIIFMFVGAGLVAAMTWMRTRFLWFPLHPAGYALGMNFGVEYFWTCTLLAWAIKITIMRYGGHKAHQKALPFFYGIILGEFTVGAFWSALSVVLQRYMYDFSPG